MPFISSYRKALRLEFFVLLELPPHSKLGINADLLLDFELLAEPDVEVEGVGFSVGEIVGPQVGVGVRDGARDTDGDAVLLFFDDFDDFDEDEDDEVLPFFLLPLRLRRLLLLLLLFKYREKPSRSEIRPPSIPSVLFSARTYSPKS